MLQMSILVSWLTLVFHCFEWRVWSHPSMGGKGPSSGGWEYSSSGRDTGIVIPPDMGVPTHFTPPLVWPCQPWPSLVTGCIHLGVHYPPASMGIDICVDVSFCCNIWRNSCCLSAIPSDLMKSTAVDESLSSMNQQFCSRENQLVQKALTLFPLPHVCAPSKVHSHFTLPKVFTHLWWMLQWMSTAEVITSH